MNHSKLMRETGLKISIIIPCYNVEAFIEDCLNSIKEQRHNNFEIIIVDNNSTDSTAEKIVIYKKKNPSLSIQILTEKIQGAPAARNKGLQHAKGDWIQFLDADDLLLPDKLKTQLKIIELKPDVDIIIGDYIHQLNPEKSIKFEAFSEDIYLAFIKARLGITSSQLWKKNLLDDIGGWDVRMPCSQEYELIFDAIKKNASFGFDAAINTVVIKREGSISNQGNDRLIWYTLIDQRIRFVEYLKKDHPTIYQLHKTDIKKAMLGHFSALGLCDLKLAEILYNKVVNKRFFLKESSNGKVHQWTYNLLGFYWGTKTYKWYIKTLKYLNRYAY